jgi:NRPS condensation-like uncharacterized protein
MLAAVRSKGVLLWMDQGQLRFKAPRGALQQNEVEALKTYKSHIVDFLEQEQSPALTAQTYGSVVPRNRAPLTYSQLAHWHLHRLYEKSAIRQVALAVRLHGRLNTEAFKRSVNEVVQRHRALHIRVFKNDHGEPIQEISGSIAYEMKLQSLVALPSEEREAAIQENIRACILEAVDLSQGPLFAARLLKATDEEHVFIFTMEHLISDAVSRSIFLRDLLSAYDQLSRKEELSLPPISLQFMDYARQQSTVSNPQMERHRAFWSDYLAGGQRMSFPITSAASHTPGWGNIPVRIGSELKQELMGWCRLHRTTIVMAVFSAYVAEVMDWCGVSEGIVRFQTDGRTRPEVENTIGYFATILNLRLQHVKHERFVDLLKRVTQEYCRAYGHVELSCMEALVPRPDFTRNTVFNWVHQADQRAELAWGATNELISCSPIPFVHPMHEALEADEEPSILLHDIGDEVVGDLYFPLDRCLEGSMRRFTEQFLDRLERAIRE